MAIFRIQQALLTLVALTHMASALNNGQLLTPPMGFNRQGMQSAVVSLSMHATAWYAVGPQLERQSPLTIYEVSGNFLFPLGWQQQGTSR
jgi:hypothetical protein